MKFSIPNYAISGKNLLIFKPLVMNNLYTHVLTGMDVRAALTDEDVAGHAVLAVCLLHTETLGLGVTSVFGGTNALFMGKKL